MGGTSTHAVRYEGLHLPEEAVVLRAPYDGWAVVDSTANQNVQPSTFGIALAALDLLEQASAPTAAALRERVLEVRERAYALIDDVDPAERGDERLALRARALLLAPRVLHRPAGLAGRARHGAGRPGAAAAAGGRLPARAQPGSPHPRGDAGAARRVTHAG
jgi:hypothetical protein